jgi:hypothetical protein
MNSNHRLNYFAKLKLAWLGPLCVAVLPVTVVFPAQTNTPTGSAAVSLTQPVPRSVFIQPASPSEGCDPFFPTSVRPYSSNVVTNGPTSDLTSITIKGISGDPDHRLVIINNVTFAVGDEAEVLTAQGRIRIHCLMISEDSAVIEAAGQRQMLHYSGK